MPKIGYIVFCLTFSLGIVGMIYHQNYFRKIISFAIFSSSTIILFITTAYKNNSIASFHSKTIANSTFTDPTPSVLMLTAIVVGISFQSIALSIYISSYQSKKTEE
jgi:multicomponent Na+:H+ antiporter subunit C